MAYSFTSSQSAGDLETATLTDTSDSLAGITGRLIYIQKYTGDYLVPTGYTTDYIVWPIGSNTIDINDLLDKDYCVDISVKWFTGSTITATTTVLTLFTGYGDLFLRQLTQRLAANRVNISNKNFWENKNKLRVLLDDAAQAVSLLNDQTIAQFCLDEEYELTQNISSFF